MGTMAATKLPPQQHLWAHTGGRPVQVLLGRQRSGRARFPRGVPRNGQDPRSGPGPGGRTLTCTWLLTPTHNPAVPGPAGARHSLERAHASHTRATITRHKVAAERGADPDPLREVQSYIAVRLGNKGPLDFQQPGGHDTSWIQVCGGVGWRGGWDPGGGGGGANDGSGGQKCGCGAGGGIPWAARASRACSSPRGHQTSWMQVRGSGAVGWTHRCSCGAVAIVACG